MLQIKSMIFILNKIKSYFFYPSKQRNLKRKRRSSFFNEVSQYNSGSLSLTLFLIIESTAAKINKRLNFRSNIRKDHIMFPKSIPKEKTIHPK